jgi:hypothetical protein
MMPILSAFQKTFSSQILSAILPAPEIIHPISLFPLTSCKIKNWAKRSLLKEEPGVILGSEGINRPAFDKRRFTRSFIHELWLLTIIDINRYYF